MKKFIGAAFAAMFLLAPGVSAQTPACGDHPTVNAPTCDGGCPPGQGCFQLALPGGPCGCSFSPGTCGDNTPFCNYDCGDPNLACVDSGGGACVCQVIPTLSEWGIMGMALVMLGGVLYQRRRRETHIGSA